MTTGHFIGPPCRINAEEAENDDSLAADTIRCTQSQKYNIFSGLVSIS
jgi:tRNA-binding EMAP/Myf-like protein